jgi:hypothetical protein
MHNLAINYTQMGRFADSVALHELILQHQERTGEPGVWTMMTFAVACQGNGQFDRAERLLREAVGICRKQPNSFEQRFVTANACGWLARALVLQKRFDEAEPFAQEAVATWKKVVPQNQRCFYWVSLLGAVRLGQGKYAEAEPLLLQGYLGMKRLEATLPANEKRRMLETGERVIHFYEVTNQPEKAREWRHQIQQSKNKK